MEAINKTWLDTKANILFQFICYDIHFKTELPSSCIIKCES